MDTLNINKKSYSEPLCTKDLSEFGQILIIEFSKYTWSQDIILLGFRTKILLGHLKFSDFLDIDFLTEFSHPCRCTCLSLSPETNLSVLPNVVTFCAAGSDFNLRIFKSDLDNNNICNVLNGHSGYINDVAFDIDNKYVASTSDDNLTKIWSLSNFKCIATLELNSPGVSVSWHFEDAAKILVAEKLGIIRLYNMENYRQILSIDVGKPMSFCHWSPTNSQIVASLQLGELSIWNFSEPGIPKSTTLLFTDNGGSIKFNAQGDLIAGLNRLEGTLKAVDTNTKSQRFSTTVILPTNFCWHQRLPLLCLGDDTKLQLWRVSVL